MENTTENYRNRFRDILEANVSRKGIDKLLDYLDTTDFYTAPASTRYHLACEHGLVAHSISVYETMMDKHFKAEEDSLESFLLCSLLHDLCKVNIYKISMRNVKNEQTDKWEKQPFYQVEDSFPYGHGEKSVFIVERFLRLTSQEAMAIRWHMGGFDDAVKGGSYSLNTAFQQNPLAVKLHLSDMESTYLRETLG